MSENITTGIFFILGETKYVTSKVFAADETETVVVTTAFYELKRLCDNVTEAMGNLTVSGSKLKALISPEQAGKYILTETVTVGAETFKKSIPVNVAER